MRQDDYQAQSLYSKLKHMKIEMNVDSEVRALKIIILCTNRKQRQTTTYKQLH